MVIKNKLDNNFFSNCSKESYQYSCLDLLLWIKQQSITLFLEQNKIREKWVEVGRSTAAKLNWFASAVKENEKMITFDRVKRVTSKQYAHLLDLLKAKSFWPELYCRKKNLLSGQCTRTNFWNSHPIQSFCSPWPLSIPKFKVKTTVNKKITKSSLSLRPLTKKSWFYLYIISRNWNFFAGTCFCELPMFAGCKSSLFYSNIMQYIPVNILLDRHDLCRRFPLSLFDFELNSQSKEQRFSDRSVR